MIRNPFTRKLVYIRFNYGAKAADYFHSHFTCEVKGCTEDRIACLTVHHVAGKSKNVFKTLCLNHHAILHAHKCGWYTGADYVQFISSRLKEKTYRELRNNHIKEAVAAGLTHKEAGKLYGLSRTAASEAVKTKK